MLLAHICGKKIHKSGVPKPHVSGLVVSGLVLGIN